MFIFTFWAQCCCCFFFTYRWQPIPFLPSNRTDSMNWSPWFSAQLLEFCLSDWSKWKNMRKRKIQKFVISKTKIMLPGRKRKSTNVSFEVYCRLCTGHPKIQFWNFISLTGILSPLMFYHWSLFTRYSPFTFVLAWNRNLFVICYCFYRKRF